MLLEPPAGRGEQAQVLEGAAGERRPSAAPPPRRTPPRRRPRPSRGKRRRARRGRVRPRDRRGSPPRAQGRCRTATRTAPPARPPRAARARSRPAPRSSPRPGRRGARPPRRRGAPSRTTAARSRASAARTSRHRSHGTGRPASSRWIAAVRHGCADRRLAARQRHRLEVCEALEAGEVAAEQLAAPERPVRAVAGAVEDERERRAALAVLGEAGGGVGVVVLDPDELRLLRERPLRREVLGVEVVRDRLRPAPRASRCRAGGRRGTRGRPRSPSRSPRCGERNASPPRATQKVAFSSGPAATSGRGAATGNDSGTGTKPRERRTGNCARTTESSQRRWIGRSCARKASAIPPSRSRASSSPVAIGSSERFPLVITSARPASASRRWWSGVYGSISPSHGEPGATEAATGASARRRQRTIGRSREASSASSSAPSSASASGRVVMTANGLSSRSFRPRRRATASSSPASQARW